MKKKDILCLIVNPSVVNMADFKGCDYPIVRVKPTYYTHPAWTLKPIQVVSVQATSSMTLTEFKTLTETDNAKEI